MGAQPLTFFCVLRAGKKYGAGHVERLQAAVQRNCRVPHRFVALSDVPVQCERIEFKQNWPVWWSKLELFRRGVADPAGLNIYIDLDVLITGRLDQFATHPHDFSMVRDDFHPKRANSSVMAWTGDRSHIYQAMVDHGRYYQFIFRPMFGNITGWFGEQALTERLLIAGGKPADRIDDIFPGCFKIIRMLPKKERPFVNDDEMKNVLFVSFQGGIPKPGSSRLHENQFVQKYW